MGLVAGSIKSLLKRSDCEFKVRTSNLVVHLSLTTFSHVGRGTEEVRVGLTCWGLVGGGDITNQKP